MAYSLASLSAGQAIQAIYIGYYTRAADPYGFEFWLDLYQEHLDGDADGDAGLSLAGIANDFATQAETKAAYPFFESPNLASATNFITQVYLNLFDRVPDQAGLDFWAGVLSAGTLPTGEIVMAIIEGAVGGDIDTLSNKIEAATYFSQQAAENGIGTESNPITNDPEAMAAAKAAVDGAGNDGFGADDLAASKAATDAFIGDYGVVTPDDETFILTSTTDVVVGGDGNDTILGNEATLNNSDDLDGGAGDDILKVSVSAGSGDLFVAPTLSNIETVEVNGPNIDYTQDITIDLSNADGYSTLRSFQTTVNAPFTPWMPVVAFRDIQNVNGTDIEIIDTDVDHLYTYDTNAYATLGGGLDDAADILVQEVDGSDIILANEDGGRSDVDIVNLTSLDRSQVNSTTFNYIHRLEVGASFNELNVTGDADLEIEHFLDENLNDVDASTLDGDFIVDLIGQGERVALPDVGDPQTLFNVVGDLTVLGSMGDNRVDVSGDTNGTFIFQDGDDVLRVGNASDTGYQRQDVFGHLNVATQGGDDTVVLNATGVQQVLLGDGNDELYVNGNVDDLSTTAYNDGQSFIDAGAGNDYVDLDGQADIFTKDVENLDNDYQVLLGDGHDTLVANQGGDHIVDGGDGDDDIIINGNGDQVVTGGDGDDLVNIMGDGDQTVDTGAGDDQLLIAGDGDASAGGRFGHIISMGDGNDTGTILGDGVHDIDLGAGDDWFYIEGSRVPDNNIDNTIEDRQTTINAGDGDDYVGVNGDHFLLADLGAGNDAMELNADELSADDAINGNEGIDTLILHNSERTLQGGRVGASETSSTQSIEIFDLREANFNLRLTSDNFDTAQDKHITVQTTQADEIGLPAIPVGNGSFAYLSNGMSRADYNSIATQYFNYSGNSLNDYLLANGVSSIHFVDENADGDADVVSMSGQQFAAGDNTDTVDFYAEVAGSQTVDITDVPLSIGSGRSFELQGGNIRDIIVADDASINGRLILDYDYSADTNHSALDTLQVIDGAQITAADLRNVNGLEIIELMSASNDSQIWDIELNDRVINQTTGNAPLIIRVDPDVPEGSAVHIQLDPSIWNNSATNDVIIENVANAEIYIDGVLVTEPDYGVTDYNPSGLASIMVVQRLVFTENTDSLVGRDDVSDIFWADSLSELQDADSADGGIGGQDVLYLDNVTVSDPDESFHSQINSPELVGFEELVFDTGMNVEMEGLGGALTGGDSDLNTVRTGAGNDNLEEMEAIGSDWDEGYFLNGGDDFFETEGDDGDYYVDGGAGDDVAEVEDDDDIMATDIETIYLEGNADAVVRTIIGTDGNTMTITGRPDTNNNNYVQLDSDIMAAAGGLATVQLFDIEEVVDTGNNNNNIVLDNDRQGPDGDALVVLNGGNDNLTVTNVDELEVSAQTGTKTVNVGGGIASNVETFSYTGGTGVFAGVDNVTSVTDDDTNISTGDLADTINATTTQDGDVTIDGGSGNDTITVDADGFASVMGGSGDDSISVFAEDGAIVNGGSGDDVISVEVAAGWTSANAEVNGGDGDDSITVTVRGDETSSIDTGLGIDNVTLLDDVNGGEDSIIFGNIVYDAQQEVAAGTTQNFTQHGVDDAGYTGSANDGVDVITGFNMEGSGAGDEDILDFSAFVTDDEPGLSNDDDIGYGDWTGGNISNVSNIDYDFFIIPFIDEYKEVAVVAVDDGFVLDASHIVESGSGDAGIEVFDDGARVVITAYDTDNDGAFDTADIYYVQDVDQDAGQAWAVDHVATVEFATEIGAITSIDVDNLNF
ncbi:protein of unknown function [Thalassovita litoralis]|uniref:DUF4214 domain-containing protein n=1 Tax=Thalassovita litoralis TaxID=1010611 RepID=A0A521E7V7_9RHOB|nr:DUF4214 domain-containing protein [Thalassovita litoralis]SMO80004.1 protein of unknown function [Thalassovita litoralis]